MGGLCEPEVTATPSSTTVVSGTNLPEWMSAGGQDLFENAKALSQTPYQTYQGQRVADLTDMQKQAQALAGSTATAYQPYLQTASDMTTAGSQQWDANQAETYMNPYQSQVMDDVTARMQRQFDRQGQDAAAKAMGQGAFAGGERFNTLMRPQLAGEQSRSLGGVLGEMGQTGYEGARAAFEADMRRQQAGAQQMAQLGAAEQTLGAQGVGLLQSGGAAEAARMQGLSDQAYNDFIEQRQHPYQQLNFALGALGGVPYSQQQSQTTTGTNFTPGTSALGQIAGIGMTGLGAYKSGLFG